VHLRRVIPNRERSEQVRNLLRCWLGTTLGVAGQIPRFARNDTSLRKRPRCRVPH
jgi:hypothetical protein